MSLIFLDPALAPAAPVPDVISDRQFAQGLALQGQITQDEALAWVGPGTIPAALEAILTKLPTDDAFAARMLLTGATEFRRSHPLVATIGSANGWTAEQIDEFWRFCAAL